VREILDFIQRNEKEKLAL